MRRKYSDCKRRDGNCTLCPMVNDNRDCHNRIITKLERARLAAGLTLKQLSEASGVNVRQIQRVELGESEEGNLTARNLLALADALGVDARELI